jgi:hypothetical protein
MVIRTTLIGALVVIGGAYAQGPGFGRGPGGPGARLLGAEAGMPGRVVKNAPYSADVVTETTQTLPDGNHIKQSNTVHVYRDSEGRTRREQTLNHLSGLAVGAANGNLPQVAFINDPVAGVNYALDMTNRTASKSAWNRGNAANGMGRRGPGGPPNGNGAATMARFGGGAPAGMARRGNQNVKTESLGKQMIEGVQADGTRTTMTIPAGEIGNEQPLQVVTETWYSPELQTVVLRKRSDPRSGDTVTRYMNVSRTEPPRTMFEPPADFKTSETGHPQRQRQ